MAGQPTYERLALAISNSALAQDTAEALREAHDWVPMEEADVVVALGGDGFMLRILPVYGVNRGTMGFLMNKHRPKGALIERVNRSRPVGISPLRMEAVTQDGETRIECALNEVSLLRETRQTAKIEILVDGKTRIEELVADGGVLVAPPAGSTAYNLSANGPILPLDSQLLALTPISAFRPRRWRGAILPERVKVTFRINEPAKRPVAAVADQKEVRDVAEVHVEIARDSELTLLFDKGHSLDDRIVAEQFVV